MGAVYEKIVGQKTEVKILSGKMGEMVAVCKKIASKSESCVKNSKTENQYEKLESVKILDWKIGVKICSQD